MNNFNQKDIVLINYSPTKGHEQSGLRPAVIISSDLFSITKMIITCPITTNIKNRAGSIILKKNKENNLKENSEIMTGQIRTVSVERVFKKIGKISQKELQDIFENLDLLFER